jgi:hypothetical protein
MVFLTLLFQEGSNKDSFKHLAGIHYLTDSMYAKMSPTLFYNLSYDRQITKESLRTSQLFISKCRERLHDFSRLGELLTPSVHVVHPFDKSKVRSNLKGNLFFYKGTALMDTFTW